MPPLKARLVLGRKQRDMRLKWRTQFEGSDLTREVEKPNKAPLVSPGVGNFELIARYVERRTFPPVGRLYLNEARGTIWFKAGDVVTSAITILL